jgi:hypothetical protein
MAPILVLLVIAAFVLAYANGANDNFKATATIYGSGTLGYEAARRLATFAQLAGSLASIALATGLLKAFSGKGLVPAEVVGDPRFLVAVATGGSGHGPGGDPVRAPNLHHSCAGRRARRRGAGAGSGAALLGGARRRLLRAIVGEPAARHGRSRSALPAGPRGS